MALARHPRLPREAFELEVLESAAIADIAQAVGEDHLGSFNADALAVQVLHRLAPL